MYVIIDNYDSFTYNLAQYLGELTDKPVRVVRNDTITLDELEALAPTGIVISPGPGRPEEAGISVEAIRRFAGRVPILGVCLGHQAIGYAFGAKIVGAARIVHGKAEEIENDGRGIFRSVPSPCRFVRYHSLVIDPDSLPVELEVTARSHDGEIMGVRHRSFVLEGVQFHPESIGSDYGRRMLANFLSYRREPFLVKDTLERVIRRSDMSRSEAEGFMEELTAGNLSDARIAAFLTALNAKGITPEEIAGCAGVLQRKRRPVTVAGPLLDTCGTGGDGFGTFNISSMAALVATAAGAQVAKHGNRAVSSLSGSADFYAALGITITLEPDQAARLLSRTGFAFLFAPLFHQALKYAAPVRRELGIKTIMNLLGPLVNPAGAEYQLIGVYDEKYCVPIAKAAHLLGVKRAVVVHSFDGMDEISVSAPTTIVTIHEDGRIEESILHPEQFGLKPHPFQALKGGTGADNARTAREILAGGGSGAVRDAVLLNAGAGLYVYGASETIRDGYEAARSALVRGAVGEKLEEIIAWSRLVAERQDAVPA